MQHRLTNIPIQEAYQYWTSLKSNGMIEKIWIDVIREDMDAQDLNKDIFLDRNEWRRIIYVIDPAQFSYHSCNLSQELGIKGSTVFGNLP